MKIRGVSKSFGDKLVLNDVSFDINDGEIFGIIGASGAGKTTLLQSMVGFYQPNKGEIIFRKEGPIAVFSTLEQDSSLKNQIGFSTQYPSFYDKLTVKENLGYFAELYNIPKEFILPRIKKILELVELTADANTLGGELSGGMQKRLDIACSLINDPKIIILDEPTADLDPLLRTHIWKLIKKINSLGKTVIISSHFLDEIDALCSRIAIINNKVALVGTVQELRSKMNYDKEIILNLESKNYAKVASFLKGMPISKMAVRGNVMVIYAKQPESLLKNLVTILEKENETILQLEVQSPTLNDVFISIMQEGK